MCFEEQKILFMKGKNLISKMLNNNQTWLSINILFKMFRNKIETF